MPQSGDYYLVHLFTYLKNNCDLKPPTSPPTHSRVLSPVEDVGAPPAPLTPVRVEVRLGEALLSSPSTHSVSRVERPAGSLEGADSIFLFGRRRGRPCVAAASGGGLSGWLITMFPPPLTLVSPLNGSRGRCRQLLHHCFL